MKLHLKKLCNNIFRNNIFEKNKSNKFEELVPRITIRSGPAKFNVYSKYRIYFMITFYKRAFANKSLDK